MENELITIPEAARRKGVSRQAIHAAINDNRLSHVVVMEPVKKIRPDDLASLRINRKRQSAGLTPKGNK